MKEKRMRNRTDTFIFVGFWKRVLVVVIDAAIGWAFFPIIQPLIYWAAIHRSIIPVMIWSAGWTLTWLYMVVALGGTPGNLLIGIRIVDAGGKFLSWSRAVRRIIFPALLLAVCGHLKMLKAFESFPVPVRGSSFEELSGLIAYYGQPFTNIVFFLSFLSMIDIAVILLNSKKEPCTILLPAAT